MVIELGGTDWITLRDAFQKAKDQPYLQKYRDRRWARSMEFAEWISETGLPKLSKDQALLLYTGAFGKRRQEFATNGIEEIQESLDFLLYDAVKLEGRFQECVAEGGAYKLAGAGKEFTSYLLCLKDPTLFAVWNSNAERTIRKLGLDAVSLRKDPVGISYIDLLEASAVVRLRLGLADFRAVDEFSFNITRDTQRGCK